MSETAASFANHFADLICSLGLKVEIGHMIRDEDVSHDTYRSFIGFEDDEQAPSRYG